MCISRMLCMVMLAVTCTAFSMEDDWDSYAVVLGEKACIGTVAGTAEVIINSPLIYLKNMLQQPELKVSTNPQDWYRGFRMNVAAMGPTTAVQICADAGLEAVIPGADLSSKVVRAMLAGGFSAGVNGPVELIIIDQQKYNGSAIETCKKLIARAGLPVFGRGFTATAFREGAFTAGYLVGFPQVEEAIRNAQKRLKSRADNVADMNTATRVATMIATNSAVAYVGAGASTGIVVAAITHPVDTIKTRMQADYTGALFKNTRHAAQVIYRESGWAGFFSGVMPRMIRAGLAIPLIGTIKKYLSSTKTTEERA